MAGLSVNVGGEDYMVYARVHSIVIEEVATSGVVGICKMVVEDHTGTVTITEKDAVTIQDDGTTIFAGEVVEAQDQQEGVRKIWKLTCHDYNIYLDETVVENVQYDAGKSDAFILGDGTDGLFPKYRSDINATTYVSTLDASMEAVEFKGMTLREILTDLARRVPGARYYVDYDKNLHWFDTESNNAAWSVSTSPDFSTSYPFGGFRRVRSAARLANKVFVLGREVSGWVEDSASISTYGERHAVSRDNRITTAQGVTDRANAILDKYDLPRETYELWVEQDGLHAGQNLTVVNATWGINQAYYIRKMRMEVLGSDGEKRRYHLWLNDEPPWAEHDERGHEVGDATDDTDLWDIGDDIFDTDPPAAPTFVDGNLTTGVSLDSDGNQIVWIKATWGAVSDDDLDHYEIQCADNASFNWPMIFHVQAGDTREVIFQPLVGNTAYYLRVRALDWVGNYSDWSPQPTGYLMKTTARDNTPPAQVTGLSLGSSRTLVGLQWTRITEADLLEYRIWRADDVSGSPGTWATIARARLNFYIDQDFTDEEIAAQDTFWYRVQAVDTSNNHGEHSTSESVSLGQIDTDHLAAECITADKIAANTITANEIAANTITAAEIAAGTITATELNVSTLSAITADMGTLTAGEIRMGTGSVGSDFTGWRLYGTYVAGFNNDTLQAGIRASDGVIVAGGGNIVISANGIRITGTSSYSEPRAVNFLLDSTVMGQLYSLAVSASDWQMALDCSTPSTIEALTGLGAYKAADLPSQPYVSADVSVDTGTGGDAYGRIDFWLGDGSGSGDEQYQRRMRITHIGAEFMQTVWINETANANMSLGLTINQGANDDEILAVKSSDVAHGMTDYAETDTYGVLQKDSATAGGLQIVGYRDADDTAGRALSLVGRLGEDADDTKSTAGLGIITLFGQVKSGTGCAAPGSGDNLLAIKSYGTTRFIFDADGEMHSDDVIGVGDDWDEWDDLALAADLSRMPKAKWGEMMQYSAEDFERAGLLTLSQDEDGTVHAFIRHKAMLQFYACCFREVWLRMRRYERALALLDIGY